MAGVTRRAQQFAAVALVLGLPVLGAPVLGAVFGGGLVGVASAQGLPRIEQLRQNAAKRFPQPVRVGDLLGRQVLQHLESQPTIGFVSDVVKGSDDRISVIVDLGGRIAFSRRPVAVPVEAMALNGQYMEINEYSPEQIAALPTYAPGGDVAVPRQAMIDVALSGPAH